jgi:hypothetical protein
MARRSASSTRPSKPGASSGSNPVRGVRNDLIGRRVGDDIVQTGWYGDLAIKWMFSRVTSQSFLWQGLELEPDGTTWKLVTEFNLKRTR